MKHSFLVAVAVLMSCSPLAGCELSGRPGPQGEQGEPGEKGARGETGPAGRRGELYVVQEANKKVEGSFLVASLCEEGDRALSGGCTYQGATALGGGPVAWLEGEAVEPYGWQCSGEVVPNPEGGGTIVAFAVCEVGE